MDGILSEHHDAIIIGAGQSGLAAAFHLAQHGTDFVVLERAAQVGDTWRERYDSLRLYSPAKADALPGMPFPLPGHVFPTGQQMGDYLESYAQRFELPVRTGVKVEALEAGTDGSGGYIVSTAGGAFRAPQVVIAGGYYRKPYVPDFASKLDPDIRQLHSGDYRIRHSWRTDPSWWLVEATPALTSHSRRFGMVIPPSCRAAAMGSCHSRSTVGPGAWRGP